MLTELAQNAADAASRAGVDGHLRVWSSGSELHIANTGAPLDIGGVHALTALRVSEKLSGVGRFGVGFTAVRAISDEIEFLSAAGGVRFSRDRTKEVLHAADLVAPASGIPVLRLAWPANDAPAEGFSSEIVLHGVGDVESLIDVMRSEAVDLLLELESLVSIDIAGERFERTVSELVGALESGAPESGGLEGGGPEGGGLDEGGLELVTVGDRRWWQYRTEHARWLVPVHDGVPTPVSSDVLRAPTRSDEELSLPALLVADVAMQPDRRRILPGARMQAVADGYSGLLAALPARFRPRFVPLPGFARSEVDGELRERIIAESARSAWLPGVSGDNLIPARATVLPGLTEELGTLLVDVFPDLVSAELSGPRYAGALAAVDVHRVGLARLAEMLSGVEREPRWWGQFYDAVTPLVADGVAAEELAALPVPLSDGRTVTGPRTVVLGEGLDGFGVDGFGEVHWARLVHPDAASPLLARLGAKSASRTDLLSDPALEALLDELDWDDAEAVDEIVDAVLTLAVGADSLPSWIGALPLADEHGDLRAADELLLPDAPLAGLLSDDSPFGLVSNPTVEKYGADALRAIGVGWGFGVVTDELPTGPDHDLDDEHSWWDSLPEDPPVLSAVRDLDLVDERSWPEALSQLLHDSRTHAALQIGDGYTAWWLRTHAVVDGKPLGSYRAPSDTTFAGLLDPLDHARADDLAVALAPKECDSVWFTRLILSRLADSNRSPTPAVIVRAHRLVAEAVASGKIDLDDLDLPPRVRAVSGAVVDPAEAIVLDSPWSVGVVPADIAVLSSMSTASALASVLDVRTASESIDSEVVGVGRVSSWDREPGAVLACAALGLDLPEGGVVVHRELVVRLSGALDGEHHVAWWVTADGITHCSEAWERPRGQ